MSRFYAVKYRFRQSIDTTAQTAAYECLDECARIQKY